MFVFCVRFLVCAPRQCSYSGQLCWRWRWLHARILAFGQEAETAADRLNDVCHAAGGIEPRRRKRKGRSYGIRKVNPTFVR